MFLHRDDAKEENNPAVTQTTLNIYLSSDEKKKSMCFFFICVCRVCLAGITTKVAVGVATGALTCIFASML